MKLVCFSVEFQIFDSQGEAVESIHVNLMASPQHTEVNLSELQGYAKHVILELINEKNQKLSDKVLHSNPEDRQGTYIKALTRNYLASELHINNRPSNEYNSDYPI